MSTGIGLGMAVPHVRIENLGDFVICIGINPKGIWDYKSIDDIPVKVIFLIIGDKNKQKEYLKLLSSIVKYHKTSGLMDKLSSISSTQELFGILSK